MQISITRRILRCLAYGTSALLSSLFIPNTNRTVLPQSATNRFKPHGPLALTLLPSQASETAPPCNVCTGYISSRRAPPRQQGGLLPLRFQQHRALLVQRRGGFRPPPKARAVQQPLVAAVERADRCRAHRVARLIILLRHLLLNKPSHRLLSSQQWPTHHLLPHPLRARARWMLRPPH